MNKKRWNPSNMFGPKDPVLTNQPHYDLAVEIGQFVVELSSKLKKLDVWEKQLKFIAETNSIDNWSFAYAETVLRARQSPWKTIQFYTDMPILLEFAPNLFVKYGVEILSVHKHPNAPIDYLVDGTNTGNKPENYKKARIHEAETTKWWKQTSTKKEMLN
jgi:hypothetical protein